MYSTKVGTGNSLLFTVHKIIHNTVCSKPIRQIQVRFFIDQLIHFFFIHNFLFI